MAGAGEVGRRVARELVGLDAVSAVVITAGAAKSRSRLRGALGPKVESLADGAGLHEAALDVLVLCTPDETQLDDARSALAAGAHVVSLADSVATVGSLLGLDDFAREVGRSVVVGSAASPGLSVLLARHAADLFDEVDEVVIGVTGTAGPACLERRTRAARTDTQEWRDGRWVDCDARSGPELIWFPEPLGAVDCARGDLSDILLLRRVLPAAPVLSAKMGRPASSPVPKRLRRRGGAARPVDDAGVRVAVTGRIDGSPETVVYSAVAPAATSSAALAAVMALRVAEPRTDGSDGGRPSPPWAGGVAEFVAPIDALRAVGARGVRMLVFEGID
ncbi:MAG: hypothetical protein U0Q22_00390 [Acidimicrobiales bacterium]